MPEELEVRIDLPVRAFVPVGWVGQEALRLELYRRIGTARDHDELARVRTETEDRFGALPVEVGTLFGIGSFRITCLRLGIAEVTTFRKQVRIRPVELADYLELDLAKRVSGARYHRTTKTLNLEPEMVSGPELPGAVERALLEAVDETPAVAPTSVARRAGAD